MVESRLPRFYAPAIDGVLAELPADEAHHLTRVLRLGDGDDVAVFDGRGSEWRGRVERAGRAVRVRLVERVTPAAEPRVALTLAQAILKGDGMDAVVRDATMLGVAAIQPLVTRRTIARANAARAESARERWRRIAIASAKQCRRAVVPAIHRPLAFETLLAGVENGIMLIEPDAPGASARNEHPARANQAVLIVGPEGGWDELEVAAGLRAGCAPMTLGALTLRAETAPVVAISVLRGRWGDF
ncbi:MAG TPA: 16S rRNA (uracil(1498)-N(3))-methyltransferase [Vicinamibacterales bacterium]|jgi:16S rRNA (uracil1498-N3)-methyltransferase